MNLAAPDAFLFDTQATQQTEPRANVLGVGIHAVNLRRAVDLIEARVRAGQKGYVCVTGVHGVMEAGRDKSFQDVLDLAYLVVPDGMPTVWIGRLQGLDLDRVFGPDLMAEICRRSPATGITHFLYGGRPGVAEELRSVLSRRFPGIRIVGTYTPPFGPLSAQQQIALEEVIQKMSPDIVWVGLSTPKQEQFMAINLRRLGCKVMIGVGAAFDIHTGRLKDAPDWCKKLGLQWFHRLCQEPSRLWKRYLINNSGFLWKIALQLIGIRRYQLAAPSAGT
jgi:N-acetylglucosaminyldiphosphoundecaprenol N-acetyl-beta-D-mannosaminyltransferase